MGGGPKIPYPKHVWSPAGGWYAQPANWRTNTAIMSLILLGFTVVTWKVGADREFRTTMPDKDMFFPSRHWSKQIKEYEKARDKGSS